MSSIKAKKKEIVRELLKQDIDVEDEQQLMDLIADNSITTDVNEVAEERETIGDKLADKFSSFVGSWIFIGIFIAFLITWMIINVFVINPADPYPFILLNLILSCVAAIQAPIIMMSQNRQAKKDKLTSENDYKTDLKSEILLEDLHDKMDEIIKNQRKIMNELKKD